MRRAIGVIAVVAIACGSGGASVGPLRLDVPDGWSVTRRLDQSLQLADGLADVDQDAPGAARAVFDVYLHSPHTPDTYRRLLEDNHVRASEDEFDVDGRTAYVLEYTGASFAGRQIAVIIPAEAIHIVYRAAKIGDDGSFYAGRSRFIKAVRSITFSEPPSA